jgi:hypothetical protein
MKLLNELLTLSEDKVKTLLGVKLSSTFVSKTTPTVLWNGKFNCSRKLIQSLEYAPKEIYGSFYCEGNKLTSLKFGPKKVTAEYVCSHNEIDSLEGFPNELGFYFYCNSNKLTSLKDIHKHIIKMDGIFRAESNPITSHVLGILLIEGCKALIIDNDDVQEIINKYLPNKEGRKGLMKCKAELVDAGFDEFAQI